MTHIFRKITDISFPSKVDSKKEKFYKKLEPFHCKSCNRAWQPLRDYSHIADYLIGFPKIGCTIRICKNCRKEQDGTNKKD